MTAATAPTRTAYRLTGKGYEFWINERPTQGWTLGQRRSRERAATGVPGPWRLRAPLLPIGS